MQTIIEIPQFLPPTKTSGNSAAGNSIPRTPAAVFIPAPGMALTQNSVDGFSSLSLMVSDSDFVSLAKEPKANSGTRQALPLMGSIRRGASRNASATSERMDVTAGETATNSRDGASERWSRTTSCEPHAMAPTGGDSRRDGKLPERTASLSWSEFARWVQGDPIQQNLTAGRDRQPISADMIEIPESLTSAARQTQHASDGNALRASGLAVTRGRVAERGSEPDKTEFQHDEPRDHRVGIEPERAGSVIPFKRANNVATGADEC